MRKVIKLVIIIPMFCFGLSGCASFGQSMKSFLGGKTIKTKKRRRRKKVVGKIAKNRNYKRTDHKTLQEKSHLGANSGSLWIERGQGSYLFAQNTNRLIGDLVNIEIEGQAKKQVETKVKVIQNLIDRIKARQEERRLASLRKTKKKKVQGTAEAAPVAAAPVAPPKKSAPDKFEVKIVPSRITEILKDGSYVVQGDQPFMLGKREYKIVVKGIVRQEDFDDQGISAETLLDPKFDIVTNRKKRR